MLQDLGFCPQDEVGWRLAAVWGPLMRGTMSCCATILYLLCLVTHVYISFEAPNLSKALTTTIWLYA